MPQDLWKIRERKRMTVGQLSAKSGVPARLINEYEMGQRTIRSSDLSRLAQALYVDESEIELLSRPAPAPSADGPAAERAAPPVRPAEREQPGREPRANRERPEVAAPSSVQPASEPAREPRPEQPSGERRGGRSGGGHTQGLPPGPARPSQLEHLHGLARHLRMTPAELETEAGKPLDQLNSREASRLTGELIKRSRDLKATQPLANLPTRQRAYLPESVDEFELEYLTGVRESGDLLDITLFDGRKLDGVLVGFGPYSLTIHAANGTDDITIQKLAICFYRRRKNEQ